MRSHLEELPLPLTDDSLQNQCITLVEQLIVETDSAAIMLLYNELDLLISSIFGLNETEYQLILNDVSNQNLFLY